MSHKCEDCGEEFDTLTRLRLHDCQPTQETSSGVSDTVETETDSTENESDSAGVEQLDALLASVEDGEFDALHQAIATYETTLDTVQESDDNGRYREITREYETTLIEALDDATQTSGWEFLAECIDSYHPERSEEFPHVTTILQNATGRYLIRTCLSEGVDALPVAALEFYSAILDDLDGEGYDFITEGMHPFGWGIGHPDYPVADTIHDHATTDIFVVNPMLEHAFYADQDAAVTLLERIVADEGIQKEIPIQLDDRVSETRYLLDAVAGAASDEFWPTMPRYWDWHDDLDFEFELQPEVEQQVRDIARNDPDCDLPTDWEFDDLLV